ncbi:hypothetical protein BV25DRAFT_299722 [Artomyces pyxidatus]|uniref:Uncharacterized protein n=1 Tax=Artomyces pyxidatus TaxID=48021 RepID=A0ACB8T689_9AGAM|nr:hypothetical protein BV25DRAFT_299722 [Artomyces pyxidatus]
MLHALGGIKDARSVHPLWCIDRSTTAYSFSKNQGWSTRPTFMKDTYRAGSESGKSPPLCDSPADHTRACSLVERLRRQDQLRRGHGTLQHEALRRSLCPRPRCRGSDAWTETYILARCMDGGCLAPTTRHMPLK